MELGLSNTLLAGDPRLIDHIVGEVKSRGIFDQFRKECIADVDTKPAYQNLRTRVEGSVNSFLSKQVWKPDLNKNQLRETLRKHIHDAPYLDAGVERIVDQVVNPKVYSVFMSQIEDVVYKFLGVERPKVKEKNGACGLKDLLPKDLDPVSPESDKNSLKDESLESLDINDMNDLDRKQERVDEQQRPQNEEMYRDKSRGSSENGHISLEEKTSDETYKILNKNGSNLNLNTSAKLDDKMDEEEEEVSPTFEPIDIMNLNESNISNDSHLSGISELTSHRSRSPYFSNELSRDNFEYSNHDSQLSKVSSDSRLSIVTDFGSSNHALTPIHDSSRDETTRDKYEVKSNKDNFKAIVELDSSKNKTIKSTFDFVKDKDTKDFKGTKSVSSKENSRDATDSSIKDKYDHKSKEKSKDSESTKLSTKSTKEKSASKDTKYYKDKNNERKRSSNEKYDKHSSEKYDKHSKSKPKDKIDQTKESSDKTKDISENLKDNANKLKDEKLKEIDKKDKDNVNKEVKDLKDIYKEKIRELREKKELTEKEKLNKDKDVKLIKETKDKKDPLKDKKSTKKEHKSSSSSSSSSSKNPVSYHESKSSKTSEKIADGKDKRSDSKDKARRDEKRLSKESKSKSHYSSKSDLSDKSDKSDSKKVSKSEKEDKSGKMDAKKDVKASSEKSTNGKKDTKSHLQQSKNSDRVEKSDGRKESKTDSPSKDKKRREDKKSKMKDDHSSLRKNSNDRRSTDRDGSNGSNNKTLPPSNSNSNVTSSKSSTSNLTKDNHVSNSSSETSDSIEETQVSDSKTSHQSNCKLSRKISSHLPTNEKSHSKVETDNSNEAHDRQEEEEKSADSRDLPPKKRPLSDKDSTPDVKLKKPKFAKNIHEAKKLMKIRKQMEKQKLKEDKKVEKKVTQEADQTSQSNTKNNPDNLEGVPDDERVQIIEIPDEEYEEPYPEKHEPRLMLDERSIIMPGAESCANDFLKELCIGQSSSEVSNAPKEAQTMQDSETDGKHKAQSDDSHVEDKEDSQISKERHKDDTEEDSKNKTKHTIADEEKCHLQAEETLVSQKLERAVTSEKSDSLNHNENKSMEQSTEENMTIRDYNQGKTQDDNKETKNDNTLEIRDDNKELSEKKQIEIRASSKADTIESQTDCMENKSSPSAISNDNEDCRYFMIDNEKSERFSNFLESLEFVENSSLEDIIESLGGKVVFSIPRSMAPPLPKSRKRSYSPLSDILVNNSDNNNDGHKQKLSSPSEDSVHSVKKRKYTKKSRFSNLCNPQGISNGENFVMPLSPDSDVSATSDKTASTNVIKVEKSRIRTSHQRYSSDDLYKPRPLFSSSSRRSRRCNQA